jgi:hypothetical protein
MPRPHPSESVTELERKILRAFCARESSPEDWNQLAHRLADYSWQEPDHRVIYDALRGIRTREAKTRRDQLPAQATRMGFPDVDWSRFFEPVRLPEPEIEELIRQLKAETAERS